MKLPRRKILHFAAGVAALTAMPRVATALDYPTRPVRLVVGFPAGTSPDIIARLIAQPLSERIGQQIIIDNRPGAANNIATEIVVKAPADGYTLLLVPVSTSAANVTLYPALNFQFARDIAPVAMIGGVSFVMVVNPSLPTTTVPEFIAYAKANPGKLNMASVGNGTAPHLFGELFKIMTGVDFVHVPYRSSFYPDLLAGRVQFAFVNLAASIGYIRNGKLRALAVATAKRSELLPNLPSVGESVPGYEASAWEGIGAPANTPPEVVTILNKEINAIISDPQNRAHLVDLGMEPVSMTPTDFGRLISTEVEKWSRVIRVAGIKAD